MTHSVCIVKIQTLLMTFITSENALMSMSSVFKLHKAMSTFNIFKIFTPKQQF